MGRSTSVDGLSSRFREMSLHRDRLIDGRGGSWILAEDKAFHTRINSGRSLEGGCTHSSYRNHQAGGTAYRTPSSYIPLSARYNRDVVDDRDRLPSSYTSHRQPFVNRSSPRCTYRDFSDRNVNCRWVNDAGGGDFDGDDGNNNRNSINSHISNGYQCGRQGFHQQEENNEQRVVWGATPSRALQLRRPSPLLFSLTNIVALRRGVRRPQISQEVIIAFQSSVARGTFMLKFVPRGAPHKRFFVIRFLDRIKHNMEPDPVLAWYASSHSWNMRRYLPLQDLIAVVDGGAGHPAVERRMVEPGLIKGSYVDLRASYLSADFILQLHFRSPTGGEEVLAVKLLDKSSYVAWRIVTDFFSRIGSAQEDGR